MKSSSLSEIKAELTQIDKSTLVAICVRLAKFRKENKELVSYLLFEAQDPEKFLEEVKQEIWGMFQEINMSSVYFIKKSIRKILRTANRYVRFAAEKTFEAEILIYFCNCILEFKIPLQKSNTLNNLYLSQRKKIGQALETLHPDLQYDLNRQLKSHPE
ncbi:MAG: hypothetical protein KGM98_10465 [Bacteroidota bacterium]|nr:hypothetical protein [Bacteroidota bacterium]